MKHELKIKTNFRTDLAIDNISQKSNHKDIHVFNVNIDKKLSKILKKRAGNYLTIEFKDITDIDNRNRLIRVLIKVLKKMLKSYDLCGKKCLVVGLGNINVASDSLGPKVVKKIITTSYLNDIGPGFSNVAAYNVGIKGETGFESIDIIKSLVKIFKPSFVLVIDSLVTKNLDRLNQTIQITDCGINPGSGIGNNRNEISEKTLHVKTIALGVPTVVDLKSLINLDYDMMVTSKEIDFLAENLSEIIATSINCTLHNKLNQKWHF